MASDKEIGMVMATLSAAYPHLSIPNETGCLYREELADVPADALMDAARAHIRRSKWFPTIAELREPYEAAKQRKALEAKEFAWKRQLEGWKEERALEAGNSVVAMEKRRA